MLKRRSCARATGFLVLGALAACSPPLDWREARPGGSDVTMLFPCRPEHEERLVAAASEPRPMHLHVCHAAGIAFSLMFGELADPSQVTGALASLKAAAIANIAGTSTAQPWQQSGTTPNAQSVMLRIEGRLPDGRPVVEHAAFFVKGLMLYQATVLGDAVAAETVETFFAGIRLTP